MLLERIPSFQVYKGDIQQVLQTAAACVLDIIGVFLILNQQFSSILLVDANAIYPRNFVSHAVAVHEDKVNEPFHSRYLPRNLPCKVASHIRKQDRTRPDQAPPIWSKYTSSRFEKENATSVAKRCGKPS